MRTLCQLTCFSLICFCLPMQAQLFLGSDPTWGEQGAYVSSLSGYQSGPVDLFVRPDGNLIFVGNSIAWDGVNASDPFTTLLDPDGRPIRNYGHLGSRMHEGFTTEGVFYNLAAAMFSDGSLLIGASSSQSGIKIKHVNGDGDTDTTFADQGNLFVDHLGPQLALGTLLILPDDRIIVAGGLGQNGSISRFWPTGALDTTFGVQGHLLLTGLQPIRKVKVLPDGRLFCGAGPATELQRVIMLTPDGQLDTSFTGDGQHGQTFLNSSGFGDFAMLPDGRFILCGPDILVRIEEDGSALDNTFMNVLDGGNGLYMLPDGRFLTLRYSSLLRYLPNGSLDPTFGLGGWIDNVDFTGIRRIINFPQSKLLLFGGRQFVHFTTLYFDRVRLMRLDSLGGLDSTFARVGFAEYDSEEAFDQFSTMTVDPFGRAIVATSPGGPTMAVARFTTSGLPDSTFSDDGAYEPSRFYTRCMDTQSDGSLIIGVDHFSTIYETHFKLHRLGPNGAFDDTFGPISPYFTGQSERSNNISDVLVGPNNEVYAGVSIGNQDLPTRTGVVKYNSSGVVDTGFGTNGEYVFYSGLSNQFFKMGFFPNGDILLVQAIQDSLGYPVELYNKLLLTRLSPSGAPVSSWGINGQVKTDLLGTASIAVANVSGMVMFADGKFAIHYFSYNLQGEGHYLARFQPNGDLDPAFNGNGVLPVGGGSPIFRNDETLVALENGTLICGYVDSVLTFQRVLTDGSLDEAFGDQGSLLTTDPAAVEVANFSIATDATGNVFVAGAAKFNSQFPLPVTDSFIFKLPFDLNVTTAATAPVGTLRVFPNPVGSSVVRIDAPELRGHELKPELFDISGRLVVRFPQQVVGGGLTLQLPADLMDGAYALIIRSAGQHYHERLIIQRNP